MSSAAVSLPSSLPPRRAQRSKVGQRLEVGGGGIVVPLGEDQLLGLVDDPVARAELPPGIEIDHQKPVVGRGPTGLLAEAVGVHVEADPTVDGDLDPVAIEVDDQRLAAILPLVVMVSLRRLQPVGLLLMGIRPGIVAVSACDVGVTLMQLDAVQRAVRTVDVVVAVHIAARLPALARELVAGLVYPFEPAAVGRLDRARRIGLILEMNAVEARDIDQFHLRRGVVVVVPIAVDQVVIAALVVHAHAARDVGVVLLDLEVVRSPGARGPRPQPCGNRPPRPSTRTAPARARPRRPGARPTAPLASRRPGGQTTRRGRRARCPRGEMPCRPTTH